MIDKNERVGLEFSSVSLELAFRKIIKEKCRFEFIGKNIIILPRIVAEKFKRQPIFECKEVKIISLSSLPREEANRIRKRHLFNMVIKEG